MADTEVTAIAPDGDAILLVSYGKSKQSLKLRIESRVLQTSSRVFKTILSPYFAKGRQLDAQNPPEIALEDDPDSMRIICHVLHFQHSKTPKTLSARQVMKLAHVVDKYGLLEAMEMALEKWFIPSEDLSSLYTLLDAAILLRSDNHLEAVTRALMLHVEGPFLIAPQTIFEEDYVLILSAMEQKRAQLKTEINDMIFRQLFSISCKCGDKGMKSSIVSFLGALEAVALTPNDIFAKTLAEVLSQLEDLQLPVGCGCESDRLSENAAGFVTRLRELKLFKGINFVDIDCTARAVQL